MRVYALKIGPMCGKGSYLRNADGFTDQSSGHDSQDHHNTER